MNELPTLKNLCLDQLVKSGNNQAFEQLLVDSDVQQLYLRHLMVAFFGGKESNFGHYRDGALVPDIAMADRVREMLKESCPITFPYSEMKDKTLYIHGLGRFGFDKEDKHFDEGQVYVDCQYLVLGTKEKMLYALVCEQETDSDNNASPDFLPCNYNVFRLSKYNNPCIELDRGDTYFSAHVACLIINGFPCTANVDYHDCTLTLS